MILRLNRWLRARKVIALALLSSCLLSLPGLRAQELDENVARALQQDPVFQSWKKQDSGVAACGRCHYNGGSNPIYTAKTDFCRLDEMKFWLNEDKHSIARRRVEPLSPEQLIEEATQLAQTLGIREIPKDWFGASNVLSKRICEKLGYDLSKESGYNQFRDNCLTCHGGYRDSSDDADFALDGGAQPGISCNYCHQEGNDAWVKNHGLDEGWRLKSPVEKSKDGMRDLVTIKTQANLCFDCHIGNRDENKFVPHEMYAAGHPPIPSIELQAFCEQMPQHWQTPSELYRELSKTNGGDEYFATNYPEQLFDSQRKADKVFWNTRKMLISALSARTKALDLLISSPDDKWADYSLYDCAACHHELQTPSYRQDRGFPAAPGRPRQHEWPETLLEISYIIFEKSDSNANQRQATTRQLETQLKQAFGEVPFGDPSRVKPIAKELQSQIEDAIKFLEQKPIDANLAFTVLRALSRTPKEELVTYDAARQVVWAMQTIIREFESQNIVVRPPSLVSAVTSLGDDSVTGVTAALPAGRNQFIFADELKADLKRRAEYDPEVLRAKLQAINEMLPQRS